MYAITYRRSITRSSRLRERHGLREADRVADLLNAAHLLNSVSKMSSFRMPATIAETVLYSDAGSGGC